jgi:alkylation response protein AidB-like acyl-CoA dehydrogenase
VDLALTEDQTDLRRAARRFATDGAGDGAPLDARAWHAIAELGWPAMAVPESHGGSGASVMDTAVVFEELGRVAASTLVFDTAVLAPAILHALDAPWAHDALGAVAAGEYRVAVVVADDIGLPSDRATRMSFAAGAGRASGTAAFVRDAPSVTHYLALAAGGDGVACALVEATASGIRTTELVGLVPHHFQVELSDVAVTGAVAVAVEDLSRAMLATVPVLCAYQVGSCQTAFELSVDYSRERVQFGKPIGTFQRVQDHIIELINGTDSARWVTNHAVWSTESHDDFTMAVHVAKAVTAEAHVAACTSAHEVHAGIGADLQYGLARHTFASRSLYSRLGDPAWHRRRIAERLRENARPA